MRGLNTHFAQLFGEPVTYTGAPPDDACCRDLPADAGVILLPAVEDGRVVGGIGAWIDFVQGEAAGDEAALAHSSKLAVSEEEALHFAIAP